MTKKLLALVATAVTFSAAPAFAQSRTYWPPGLEQHEREITRQLNNEHGIQPMQQYYTPPQYSYAPPPAQYHSPPPAVLVRAPADLRLSLRLPAAAVAPPVLLTARTCVPSPRHAGEG